MFVKKIFVAIALAYATISFADAPAPTQKQVGAYFTQWGIYDRAYYVKNVATSKSASKLTFLDYAFANIKPMNGGYECVSFDAWADYGVKFGGTLPSVDGSVDDVNGVQAIAGNFNQLKQLKAQNPNLKVLISLGGWTGSKYFSVAAATSASRQQLVSSCINLFIKGNLPDYVAYSGNPKITRGGVGSAAGVFDGIDIDWETPGLDIQGNGTTHSTSDRTNFTLLLQEFRAQLDALETSSQQYLLTAAVLTGDDHVIQTDPASYSAYLNWVNVMTYDYQGAWAATGPTSHHSQLLTAGAPRNDPYNTAGFDKRTVITALGRIPSNKIVMGIPFYARGWAGVNVNNSALGLLGLYLPATGAALGTYEAGIEDYKKIRKLRGVETYDSDVVATSKVIYPNNYFLYSAQNNPTWVSATFWSYDSPRSIQDKIEFIKKRNYAGIYGWSIDGDTTDGELVDAMSKLLP